MSKKISKLEVSKKMVVSTLGKAKSTIKSVNGYALTTTEEIVSEGIIAAEQWQTVANTALKGSLTLASNQQDIVFDAMDSVKNHIILSKKRISQLIS